MDIMLSAILLATLAILVFSFADRRVGSDEPHPKTTGYGAVLLFCAAAMYLNSHTAAVMAAAWILWRAPGWKFGGSMTPKTESEKFRSLMRHLMPAAFVLIYWLTHNYAPSLAQFEISLLIAGPVLLVFAGFAWDWSISYGRYASIKGMTDSLLKTVNARQEKQRGEIYAVCVAVTILAEAAVKAAAAA